MLFASTALDVSSNKDCSVVWIYKHMQQNKNAVPTHFVLTLLPYGVKLKQRICAGLLQG